jgi:hypothetical protein
MEPKSTEHIKQPAAPELVIDEEREAAFNSAIEALPPESRTLRLNKLGQDPENGWATAQETNAGSVQGVTINRFAENLGILMQGELDRQTQEGVQNPTISREKFDELDKLADFYKMSGTMAAVGIRVLHTYGEVGPLLDELYYDRFRSPEAAKPKSRVRRFGGKVLAKLIRR